jgi:hypothetical protein
LSTLLDGETKTQRERQEHPRNQLPHDQYSMVSGRLATVLPGNVPVQGRGVCGLSLTLRRHCSATSSRLVPEEGGGGIPGAALHAALVDAGDLSSSPLGLREDLSGSKEG